MHTAGGAERVMWRIHKLSLLDRRRDGRLANSGFPRRATTTVVGGDR